MEKNGRIFLIVMTLFVGVGAVFGATMMFIDPTGATTGMDGLLPYLQTLPFSDAVFQNLIFSGVSLLIVNGFFQLAATWLLIKKNKLANKSALLCGVLLMLWITIQFVIMPFNALSTSYFAFGLSEAVVAAILLKRSAK